MSAETHTIVGSCSLLFPPRRCTPRQDKLLKMEIIVPKSTPERSAFFLPVDVKKRR